jgi:hypothetical protein
MHWSVAGFSFQLREIAHALPLARKGTGRADEIQPSTVFAARFGPLHKNPHRPGIRVVARAAVSW